MHTVFKRPELWGKSANYILTDLLMFLYSGFSTEGERESVLLVGPIEPMAKRRIPTSLYFSHSNSVHNSPIECFTFTLIKSKTHISLIEFHAVLPVSNSTSLQAFLPTQQKPCLYASPGSSNHRH